VTAGVPTGDRYDIICVGDIAVDLYLTLSEEVARVEPSSSGRHLVLPFGAKVACDVTTTVAAGGNSANVAVACSRLGLRVTLVAYVGSDRSGREAVDALHAEGVDSSLVRFDPAVPTNRSFVLRVGHERTILVHHEQHDCHWPYLRPSDVPSWLFLSSVGRDAHRYEDQITDWLEEHPDVSLAFEPGTLQIARGAGGLARLFRRAGLVVCNREEAATITGGTADEHPTALLDRMLDLGPTRVVITDGSAGAYGTDGSRYVEVPVFPDDAPVVDRTGAGDAFAATLVAGLASGLELDEAMARAPVNSMRVVQAVGSQAGLLTRDGIEALLAAAPASYGVRVTSR
jgi:sugar/nucleoside kinase (ribokinase family)